MSDNQLKLEQLEVRKNILIRIRKICVSYTLVFYDVKPILNHIDNELHNIHVMEQIIKGTWFKD